MLRKKLENNKNTISASEINRFTYCNYQWYYERLYGNKMLKILYSERKRDTKLKGVDKYYNKSKNNGIKKTTNSNFKRGVNFHNKSYNKIRKQLLIVKIIFNIFLILIVILCFIIVYFNIIEVIANV